MGENTYQDRTETDRTLPTTGIIRCIALAQIPYQTLGVFTGTYVSDCGGSNGAGGGGAIRT